MKRTPEERLTLLEERLGHALPNRDVALAALTHKSYINEHPNDGRFDNERLEFLGDAVVDLAISDRLMTRFPEAREGELSKLRALIVNEEGLAKVARAISLGELLYLGKGEELTGGRDKPSVLADALEAVLGALYQCAGLPAVLAMVDQHFLSALEGVATGQNGADFKTRLQERAQSRLKVSPRYQVVAESGPDHAKVFEVEVVIGAEPFGRASGRSKKEAEQAAAREAMSKLEAELAPPDP